MSVAVTAITNVNRSNNPVHEEADLTSGNGHIFSVPENCVGMIVEAIPTVAGAATLKVSLNDGTVTDFTNFAPTSVGSMSATTVQFVEGGIKHVGLDPASGTWTMRVKFQVNPEVY